MTKKTVLALFGLVMIVALAAPPKASAQVSVGIGVGVPYGYVAPVPYYGYDCGYYPYYAPCVYPYGGVVIGGGWYGGGWGRGYG